jgi:glycosyltransferase involved in cell wall biosynthesis
MSMNQSLPLVSAIIPTRNRPQMLIRAVKSVFQQTYPNIELIIVDDKSEYDVEFFIQKEMGFRSCRVLKNIRNTGASGARNTGFYESRGEYIGFLDNDDEWMPQKIEKQVEALQNSDSRVGIVCTHDIIYCGRTMRTRCRKLEGNVYTELCKNHTAGNTSSPLIRRSVLEDIGLFDEYLPAAQDTDLWIRISKYYEFVTIEEPLVLIHHHDSDRITSNRRRQIHGAYALLSKHWKEFPVRRKYTLIKRIIRTALAIARK